jgi:hypothetical protein
MLGSIVPHDFVNLGRPKESFAALMTGGVLPFCPGAAAYFTRENFWELK